MNVKASLVMASIMEEPISEVEFEVKKGTPKAKIDIIAARKLMENFKIVVKVEK